MGATNLPEDPRRPDARRPEPQRPAPDRELPQSEAAFGGADAVEKTTYVTGSGTEPERRLAGDRTTAKVSAGGLGIAGWVLLAIVAAIALFFGVSLLS